MRCTKIWLLITCCIACCSGFAQIADLCTDPGFESGFGNWEVTWGNNTNSLFGYGCCPNQLPGNPYGTLAQITSGSGVDFIGGFPIVAPSGGNQSLLLGDTTESVGAVVRAKQNFIVSSHDQLLIIEYAVGIEDPGHQDHEQPYFRIKVSDEFGNAIPCGDYFIIPTNDLNPYNYGNLWYQIPSNQWTGGVLNPGGIGGPQRMFSCLPWQQLSLDLSSIPIGDTVNIEFTSGDCTLGAHASWAYVDMHCESLQITDSSDCQSGEHYLCAPDGLESYSWNGPSSSGINGVTSQCITTSVLGQYTCSAQLPSGCPIQPLSFNVSNPSPLSASFSSSVPPCSMSMNFNDMSDLNGNSYCTYHWDFGDNTTLADTSNLQSPNYTYPDWGTYTVTLTIESPGGCFTSTTSQTVTISNPLEVAFSVPAEVCLGNAVSFTNTSTTEPGSTLTSNWDFNTDGTIDDTLFSPTYTYSNTGTYTISLYVNDSNGCSDSTQKQITVLPLPTAFFTADSVCQGTATNFSDQSVSTNGNITAWEWDFENDGSTDNNQQNPAHTLQNAGQHQVYLFVTDEKGCINDTVLPVFIHSSPTPDFEWQNVCEDQPMPFTNTSSIDTGSIISYAWNFGDQVGTGITPDINYTYSASDQYNITLQAVSDNGCSDTIIHTVTVFPLPIAQFNAPDVCDGTIAVFTDQSTVSNATSTNSITQWNWDLGFGSFPGSQNQNTSYLFTEPALYAVTLEVTTNNGCKDTILGNIIIHPNPEVSFQSPNPAGCTEWCPTLVNTSTIAFGTNQSFVWDFGDGTQSTEENTSHCYINETWSDLFYDISLTVTSDFGCASSFTEDNFITIYPLPEADFSSNPTVGTLYDPIIHFTDQSIIADQYEWNFANLGSSLQQNPSFLFPNQYGANYEVCLNVETIHGCVDSVCKIIEIENEIIFYVPNTFTPDGDENNNLFYPVFSAGFDPTDFTMLIFNRWGELIWESHDPFTGWDGTYNGFIVQDGTYVWKIDVKEFGSANRIKVHGHVNVLR